MHELPQPRAAREDGGDLDHVSGGRLILGLGCGWHNPEYAAFGYPIDHKVSRFAEALEVIVPLIRTGVSPIRAAT